METFQPFLGLAQIAGILDCVTVRVGRVGFESHINTNLPATGLMLNMSLCGDAELTVVAIGTLDNADPFDVGYRTCSQITTANQAQSAYLAAIRKGDMFAIVVQLSARGLVVG